MAKSTAMIFGIIYTLVGIVGFVGSIGGTAGMAPSLLLNTFAINIVHNVVHLIIGVAGIFSASSAANASSYLKIFGWILILIAIVGLFWHNPFGILPIGGGDVWLHLVTGIIFAYVGHRAAS